MPLFRQYAQANSIQPTDAFVLDRIGTGTMFVEGLNLIAGAPYVVTLELLGTPPVTSEVIGLHIFPTKVNFQTGFTGMVLYSDALPTTNQTVNIYQIHGGISTLLGTFIAHTNGTLTISVASAPSFAVGDTLKCVAQGSDATWENITWSFLGAIAP